MADSGAQRFTPIQIQQESLGQRLVWVVRVPAGIGKVRVWRILAVFNDPELSGLEAYLEKFVQPEGIPSDKLNDAKAEGRIWSTIYRVEQHPLSLEGD